MKTLFIVIVLLIIGSSGYGQELFGTQNKRMQLIYIEKYKMPTYFILSDSNAHYTGDQGGTVVYNPYKIDQTHLFHEPFPGAFRIEFGAGVATEALGWLPNFANSTRGYKAIVQSNDPDCDCMGETDWFPKQIDINTRTLNKKVHDGELDQGYDGCTFTLFLYWVSE